MFGVPTRKGFGPASNAAGGGCGGSEGPSSGSLQPPLLIIVIQILLTPGPTPLDERLQIFLDLVDCTPEEVKDIPPSTPLSREKRRQSAGETRIYFGKHKGKQLKDIPGSYLSWAIGEKSTSKPFRKFQEQAKAYLGK